jgi:hypothetical protein
MRIEIASDFEFIVSASRLKETTKGGFSPRDLFSENLRFSFYRESSEYFRPLGKENRIG